MANQVKNPDNESDEIADRTSRLLKKEIDITSYNQSGGQTANSITNINHNYPSKLEDELAQQKIDIVFENSDVFLERTFHSENGISKRMRIMVETQADKVLNLEAFLVFDEKPLLDIPLRLKDFNSETIFLLQPGRRHFIDVAEYRADDKTVHLFSLPQHYQNSIIKLEADKKVGFIIKVVGDAQPYSKRFSFYVNKEGFQVEEIR